jgi:alkylated DNA nucleotide flippase Atl1
MERVSPSDYVELVLDLVDRIPPGRVMSYGAIAEYLRDIAGRGSARQVGTVMSRHGGPVPWHRVVAANGRLVPGHEQEAMRRHRAEGTPMRGDKVNMSTASWWPG